MGDNTVAVCALSALDALVPARLRYPVWIVATTGEEGLGNLAGVRALLDDPPARSVRSSRWKATTSGG